MGDQQSQLKLQLKQPHREAGDTIFGLLTGHNGPLRLGSLDDFDLKVLLNQNDQFKLSPILIPFNGQPHRYNYPNLCPLQPHPDLSRFQRLPLLLLSKFHPNGLLPRHDNL